MTRKEQIEKVSKYGSMDQETLIDEMEKAWREYISNLKSPDDAGVRKAMEYVVNKLGLTK